jgi:hypothetical protein
MSKKHKKKHQKENGLSRKEIVELATEIISAIAAVAALLTEIFKP